MNIYCIILHWLGYKDTLNCIDSLVRSGVPENKIIVIDNSFTRNIDELLAERPNILLTKAPTNLGYAGGNNFGIHKARQMGADYVFLINSDAEVRDDTLDTLSEYAKHYHPAVAGPVIRYHSNPGVIESAGISVNKVTGRIKHILHGKHVEDAVFPSGSPDAISGTALLIPVSLFDSVGPFREEYFLYMEDVEFCLRCSERGVQIKLAPEAQIFHKGQASVSKLDPTLPVYYSVRNHLKLAGERLFLPWPFSGLRSLLILGYYILYSAKRKNLRWKSLRRCFRGYLHYLRKVGGPIPRGLPE